MTAEKEVAVLVLGLIHARHRRELCRAGTGNMKAVLGSGSVEQNRKLKGEHCHERKRHAGHR